MPFWQGILQDPMLGHPVFWALMFAGAVSIFFTWLDEKTDQWLRDRQHKKMQRFLRSDEAKEMYRKASEIVRLTNRNR